MQSKQKGNQLAQSASSLGAGILGFGTGAKWAAIIGKYSLVLIIIGSIIHISGMYVVQMKNKSDIVNNIAKILWISAWLCMIALVAFFIYFVQQK